jgi:ATP-dependent Lon protease
MKLFDVNTTMRIPIIPVRDKVVFPHVSSTLVIGRARSVQAVQRAMKKNRVAFVVHQRHPRVDNPSQADLFDFGTLVEITEVVHLPQKLMRIRFFGQKRAKLLDLAVENDCLMGDIQFIEVPSIQDENPNELEAIRRLVIRHFEQLVPKAGRINPELVSRITKTSSLDEMADLVSDTIPVGIEEKQDLIEEASIPKRLARLNEILKAEVEIVQLEERIQSRVDKQVQKNHREYILNEQMRAIQKELKKKDDHGQDMDELREKVKTLALNPESEEAVFKEIGRLEKMMPFSPEATVVRSYLDWVVSLPWNKTSEDHMDVEESRRILNEDHFGLDKPKERLLEYLAVLKLTNEIRGPVLCFVGPPGTGKTSLAKSLARAMGREFYRISLGGVRDEAEIRGHRRTYIGSMPGRLMQALRKTKTKNPIILLDEIDKMGSDWRGDPAAALLEVLDPEQNKSFVDHYLDLGFDLSKIIFISTANSLYGIPPTLLDRMEVLRYSAYTTDEKVAIAKRFLLPKTLTEHGLEAGFVDIEEDALRKIIHHHTQEAGVRSLQRKIAQICRKVAVEVISQDSSKVKISHVKISLKDLFHYLGSPEFVRENLAVNSVGVATGLAWTEHGGETLTIEVTTVPGTGKILLTGKLGTVMQESAQAGYSLVKSRARALGLSDSIFRKKDLHVHIPEGAVPKDGPSAGIALATAIVSALTARPVVRSIAMTGEVTLRGRVLPIGGLKEKVLAAHHRGVKEVIFPDGNKKDLPEIPQNVKKSLKLTSVKTIEEVFRKALQANPLKTSEMANGKPALVSQSN